MPYAKLQELKMWKKGEQLRGNIRLSRGALQNVRSFRMAGKSDIPLELVQKSF